MSMDLFTRKTNMRLRSLPVSLALLLNACAGVPSSAPPYSRAPNPPTTSANVYIYRIGAYPTLRTPAIAIDGKKIFDPPEKSYTVVAIEQGEREFVVDWAWDTEWPDLKFPLHVVAGDALYVKISGSFESTGGGIEMGSVARLVPQAQAEAEMRECCRYIAPRAR